MFNYSIRVSGAKKNLFSSHISIGSLDDIQTALKPLENNEPVRPDPAQLNPTQPNHNAF